MISVFSLAILATVRGDFEMQIHRSRHLLLSAAGTAGFQYAVHSIQWDSILSAVGSGFCAFWGSLFAVTFTGVLGGNILSRILNERGFPNDPNVSGWSFLILFAVPAALTFFAYTNIQALVAIDLLLVLGIIIRLLQWNCFEPNGLAEFESTA